MPELVGPPAPPPPLDVVEVGLACCALEAAASGCVRRETARAARAARAGRVDDQDATGTTTGSWCGGAAGDAEATPPGLGADTGSPDGTSGPDGGDSPEATPAGGHGSPSGGTVLVVAGTVTAAMGATIKARYDATPGPVTVVAYGACATSGGPYWDSYAVTPGIGRLLPVDAVVPGCPPRPEDLDAALARLRGGQGGGSTS